MNDYVTINAVVELLRAVGLAAVGINKGQSYYILVNGTMKRSWEISLFSTSIRALEYLDDKKTGKIEIPNKTTDPRNLAFGVLKLLATRLQKGVDISSPNRFNATLREKLELT